MYLLLTYHPIKNHVIFEGIFYGVFIFFALTIGWSDTSLYLKNNSKSLKEILFLSIQLYCFQIIISSLVIIIMRNSDPQGIKNMSYSLSYYLNNHLIQTVIVAFSEEVFKFTVFIGFFSLIHKKSVINIIISVLFTCFIFGAMHGINYKATAIIPIAFNTIPCFIYLLKYRNLYILILAHFIFDTIAFISHIEPLGHEVIQFTASIALIIFITTQFIIPKSRNFFLK